MHLGERNASARLTAETVAAIHREYVPFVMTRRKLAAKYGVAETTIDQIVQRETWRHVQDGVA